MKIKRNYYKEITDQVIDLMTKHKENWFKPFQVSTMNGHHNLVSKKCYQGLNCFQIGMSVYTNGFKSNEWATYNQWHKKECNVKKGEKGTPIFYWNFKEYEDKNNKDKTVKIPFLKHYTIFNADQVEGYETKEIETNVIDDWRFLAHFKTDAFVENTGARIENNNKAFYSPSLDFIGMPNKEDCKANKEDTKEQLYYSTLLHELTHWSGHSSRCNRDLKNRFGSQAYAMEELIAETGSACLCSHLGVTKAPTPNHARYLNNWLEVLKKDDKAMIKAFTLSKASSEYLLTLNEDQEEINKESEVA